MNMRRFFALVSVGLLGCAPTADIDDTETQDTISGVTPPQVLFDPTEAVIPVPNTLGLVDTSTFRLDLPGDDPCDDLTTQVLTSQFFNTLNGWPNNTPQPIDIPVSAAVNIDTVTDAVRMFNLATGAPVEFNAIATTVTVEGPAPDCAEVGQAPVLRLIPARLTEGTTYAVVLTDGLLATDGSSFAPSVFWSLVRQEVNPVDLEFAEDGEASGADTGGNLVRFNVLRNETPFDPSTVEDASAILGIDTLWKYHNDPLLPGAPGFLPAVELTQAAAQRPVTRDEILHAFFFITQSSSNTMNSSRPGSVGSTFTSDGPTLQGPFQAPDGSPITGAQFVNAQLGDACDNDPADTMGQPPIPCFAVGKAQVLQFDTDSYLVRRDGVPQAFADPYLPMPGVLFNPVATETVTAWYFEPAEVGGLTRPADGWPVVIFGHGLGRNKSDVVGIAPQLNRAGLAVIAIDWPIHGTPGAPLFGRAVLNPCFQPNPPGTCPAPVQEIPQCQVNAGVFPNFGESADAVEDGGDGDGFAEIGCYEPILGLSSLEDLVNLRDRPKQAIFDLQQLVDLLEYCNANTCDGGLGAAAQLLIDSDRIGYIGQSLGGIFGALGTPNVPEIKAAVLNVAAVDPVTTLAFSATFSPVVVGGLQSLGLLPMEGVDASDPSTFVNLPAFQEFAFAATWIFESGDGATYIRSVVPDGGPAVLLQEVDGDTVVPNEATAILGGLLGVAPNTAATNTGVPAPSMGVTTDRILWLDYVTTTGAAEYNHGSLLLPIESLAGAGATAQMQFDAITFLATNLAAATN